MRKLSKDRRRRQVKIDKKGGRLEGRKGKAKMDEEKRRKIEDEGPWVKIDKNKRQRWKHKLYRDGEAMGAEQ